MPEHSDKADPPATADGVNFPVLDLGEFEVDVEEVEIEEEEEEEDEEEEVEEEEEEEEKEEEEEEEKEEEEEEEEGLDGEEKEVVEVDEEVEEEEVVEEVVEEYEVGDNVDEETGLLEDGVDREQEEVDEVEEADEDNHDQEAEVVEDDGAREVDMKKDEEEGSRKGEEGAYFSSAEVSCAAEDAMVGSGKGEERADLNSTETACAVAVDAKALNKVVESEGRDDDPNPPLFTKKPYAQRPTKMFFTNCKFNSTSVGNRSSAKVSELTPSEENGIHKTLGDSSKGIQLEMEIDNEALKHVKPNCLEIQANCLSLGSDNPRSLHPRANDLSIEGGVRTESEIAYFNVLEKGESYLQEKNISQMSKDSSITCGHIPQRRCRSSSPSSEPDKVNKRPANICVFYASGWCIKGSSCKFLHQKDEVTAGEHETKEDRVERSRTSNSLVTTGSEKIIEGAKVSSVLVDTNFKLGSSGSNILLQRALVRAYGTGSHLSSQLRDPYEMHTKGEFRQPAHFPAGYDSTQEEYRKSLGKTSNFESIVEKQSDDAFFPRRHAIEEKLVNGINMEGTPYDPPNSGRAYLVDTFGFDSRHCTGDSGTSSIMHQNSNSSFSFRRTEDNAIRSAPSYILNQESCNSHGLSSALNSGLGDSLELPKLGYRLSRSTASPTSGSSQNIQHLEGHSYADLERRYNRSGSRSLTRESSPYNIRPELGNMVHRNVYPRPELGDLASRQATKVLFDTWEPSQPFRSSLAIATKSISSPASQYDPILDSIEPSNTDTSERFHSFQMPFFQNASFQPAKPDSVVLRESALAKNAYMHISNAHTTTDSVFTSVKLEGVNNSVPNNEKLWNSDRLVERSNNKDTELGSEWRNLDKSRNIKEPKALKFFQAALVDFIKDLLKPWWRDGQLSKDAHKTIVKKSVEKVLSALHSHQFPSTQEAINQYLAASRPKILKLVEGYVQKHANS